MDYKVQRQSAHTGFTFICKDDVYHRVGDFRLSLFRVFGFAAIMAAAVALTGCRDTYEWNQKLTVTVATPSGEVSGSAVVHEKVWDGQLPASSSAVEYKISGEATMVDLGGGKYLFALLGGSEERAARTFPGKSGDSAGDHWKMIAALRESRPLARDAWPMLVTFGNVSDPKSVKEVNPKNLAASFGAGYALKGMTLEITDEEVTRGEVEKVLAEAFFRKWGTVHKEARARGIRDPYFDSTMSQLSRGDFMGISR